MLSLVRQRNEPNIPWPNEFLLELLKVATTWPVILGLALFFGFRVQLQQLLQDLGKALRERAVKVSLFQFAIELPLPVAQALPSIWEDPTLAEVRGLVPADQSSSRVESLFHLIREAPAFDYLIVDLAAQGAKTWLTSRLFLFSILLQYERDLRCIVFLYTTPDGVRSAFRGTASPQQLQASLARRYSWLDQAYTAARPLLASKGMAQFQFVTDFLQRIQARPQQPPAPPPPATGAPPQTSTASAASVSFPSLGDDWVMFTSGEPLQEHAAWLQADRLEEQIGIGVLQSDAYAFVEDSPDIRSLKRIQAILRRSGPFVALVDKNNKVFSKLVDRQAIIDTIITRLAELPDDSSPSKQ